VGSLQYSFASDDTMLTLYPCCFIIDLYPSSLSSNLKTTTDFVDYRQRFGLLVVLLSPLTKHRTDQVRFDQDSAGFKDIPGLTCLFP
jgi:hypothetical protein